MTPIEHAEKATYSSFTEAEYALEISTWGGLWNAASDAADAESARDAGVGTRDGTRSLVEMATCGATQGAMNRATREARQ
jgi:hypothetical protein